MQFDQEPYRGTNVFRLENRRPPLGPDWNRPGVEDGRVDLAGIDHGRADAPSAFFPTQTDSQRRLAELGRRITRTAQGAGPDSGDRADLDDQSMRPRPTSSAARSAFLPKKTESPGAFLHLEGAGLFDCQNCNASSQAVRRLRGRKPGGSRFQGLWPPSSHRPAGARDQVRSSRSAAHQAARRRHLQGEAARGIDQSAGERSLGWDAAFQMLTWLTLAEAAWPLPVPAAQALMALSSEAKLSWGSDGSMLDWEASSELTCSPLTKTSTLGQRPEFDGAGVAWETTAGPVDGVLDGVVAVLAGGVLDDVAVLAGGVLDDDVAVLAGGVLDDDVAVLAGCMPAGT